MTTKQKQRMAGTYSETIMEAVEIAERLADTIRENWPAPDSEGLDWGYVGSVAAIRDRLAAVEEFITGTEE